MYRPVLLYNFVVGTKECECGMIIKRSEKHHTLLET